MLSRPVGEMTVAYLLFFVLPLIVLPCLGLAASGWGARRLYGALLDRHWTRAGVGVVVLLIGLGLLFLTADYLVHPFSPMD